MNPSTRPVCDWSLLHVDECAHCHGQPTTVISIGHVERYLARPAPQYRLRDSRWQVPTPERTVCEHQKHDLCPTCDRLLDGLLYDLPELIHQLGVAMRKGTRFRSRGHRKGDVEKPDEAPIQWNPAAAAVKADLQRLTFDLWPDRRVLLTQLSGVAARAHQVIDRPRDREYSMCPTCRSQIDVEDHTLIVCPAADCRYVASWERHRTDLLDAMGDAMLTMADLVVVLTRSGERVDRNRINYLIRRHGLPREQIVKPAWQGDRLVTEPQWVYRLRDVRDLIAKLAA